MIYQLLELGHLMLQHLWHSVLAHIGVAGDDVLTEFNYDEIYDVLDLKIGKCRLSIAKTIEKKKII